jgi:hypothetical protein
LEASKPEIGAARNIGRTGVLAVDLTRREGVT